MIGKRKREAIEVLAGNLRKSLSLSGPPYDPREAIRLLSGQITMLDDVFPEKDGLIVKGDRNPAFVVFVNPKNANTRERFTLAHELGHLFLHMGYIIDPEKWNSLNEYSETVHCRDASVKRVEEFEANEFAAAFLMPRTEFLDTVSIHTQRGVCNTSPIAALFAVSDEAVVYRGKFLGAFKW